MDLSMIQLVDGLERSEHIKPTGCQINAFQHKQRLAGKPQNRGGNPVSALHEPNLQGKYIFLASNPSNPVERDVSNIPQSLRTLEENLKRARGHDTSGVHNLEKAHENGSFLLLVMEELQKRALHVAPAGVPEADVQLDLVMNPMLYPESLELLATELGLSGTVSFQNKPKYIKFLLKLAGDLLDV